jgi:hypothetical protein
MSQITSKHPLSLRHQQQLGHRAGKTWVRMRSVWGVSWRPGMGGGSFIGKLFRTFGTPVMMVQVGYQEGGQEHVGLFGINAQVDPHTSQVSYDKCVMRHNFFCTPRPDAKGPMLNTRNESWVQLALDVDRVRQRRMEANFVLPAVPRLPEIYYGFGSKESTRFEITPALRQTAYADQEIAVRTTALKGLNNLDSTIAAAREQAFNALPEDVQKLKLHQAWDAAFIDPRDPENPTGLYLLNHKYSTAVMASTRVFEYFGGMVGADVYNPARKLGGKVVENKALEIAKTAGVDLVHVIDALATSAEGSPEAVDMENALRALVPIFREKQPGLPAEASEDGVLLSLVNYGDPLLVEPAVQQMAEKDQIVAMRKATLPHIADCCTDEDLLQAVLQPTQPLYARGLCQVQVLHRNVKLPLAEALTFTENDLGRERVSAQLWHDLPTIKPRRARQKQQRQQQPQEVPVHVE